MKLVTLLKLLLGFLALGMAAVGLVLPVWPTTPFVLLAIGCFSSSPRLRAKLLNITFFREYYESYVAGKGIRRKTVVASLVFLWGMLLLSVLLVRTLWISLLLLVVGTAVTVHILVLSKGRKKRGAPARAAENNGRDGASTEKSEPATSATDKTGPAA